MQLGELQQAGRRVGATALLALPVARQNVRATVPGAGAGSAAGRRVQFMAPVLRDLLADVDLRRGEIVGVEPGPASRTSAWAVAPSPSPPVAAPAAAPAAPAFVRLAPHGPRFAPYDGTPSLANSTDVHLRLYAPPGTDHFTDPRFGDVGVATAHLDRGEGSATAPRLFGFSEEAEHRVTDAVARRVGWVVRRDRVSLGNAEPYRRDLAAPDHLWWSNGCATLISVP
ncbi:MAG: hypothetical protein QOD83_2001 [Solirubrobacteraceae bacterium]|nr:hypothetical protein [Solirubrobacteraceae bacterium]